MALVSSWCSTSLVGNSLTNRSGPRVLFEKGAKEGVKTSQSIKTLKASEKKNLTSFLFSISEQCKTSPFSGSFVICFLEVFRKKGS